MKRKLILGTLIGLLTIGSIGSAVYYFNYNQDNQKVIVEEDNIPHVDKPPRIESFTLTSAGDILMHNTQIWSGEQPDGTYNFENFFAPVKDYLTRGDFTTVTFEAALNGPESGYTGYPLFNSPDEIAGTIKNAGFDLVNLANNHILDRGYSGAVRTMDVFKKAGLSTIGTNKTAGDSLSFVQEIRGIKVGYLAYTESTNGLYAPDDKSYFINYFDKEKILNDISQLRPQVDVLILILHWGVEYSPQPTDAQRAVGLEFLEAGADAIIGSHPHVVQPMEYVNINGKDKVIAYAIGNFIGDQRGLERNSGLILNITFEKNFDTGVTALKEVNYIPTYSHSYYLNGRQKFQVLAIEDAINEINQGIDNHLTVKNLADLQAAYDQTKKQMGDFFTFKK